MMGFFLASYSPEGFIWVICICVVWETLGRRGSECNSSIRCVQQKLASVSLCPRISLPSAPFQYSDHLSAMKLRAFASHRVLLHMFPLDLQTASDTWPVVPASWFLGSCFAVLSSGPALCYAIPPSPHPA